jgi:hypothetical protein
MRRTTLSSHPSLLITHYLKNCSLETKQRVGVGPLFLRKEVIQPQVPLRLPCYDFTPITDHTLVRCLFCKLAHALLVQPTFVV